MASEGGMDISGGRDPEGAEGGVDRAYGLQGFGRAAWPSSGLEGDA